VIQLYILPSFERSLKSLSALQKKIAQRLLKVLVLYYESNCNLEQVRQLEMRFFHKKLRDAYYEAGIEGQLRVILKRSGNECAIAFIGNHDQIRRFLRDSN
jgi:hypothetical protein